ncbi:hypothetical protein F5984_00320 [Rudanella paleaurantiibacter]|uniref:Capsule assembly Wzi family protein n=1 Tax=Rudanella paleaurantiibacter TaxID=2614655 RepID=A0A7J5U3M7_9BACT|nr:capsule assembly Wzi family protein [Rudanella paleaurantiibacter]KAB7732442.1 hypothetical protein F5984_00320 [Rudanella paleaurantiibacter]
MQLRLLAIICLLGPSVFAQAPKPLLYRQELKGLASTAGELPFWFRANQYGVVPRSEMLYSLRSAWQIDYRKPPKTRGDSLWAELQKIDWGWGLEAVANYGPTTRQVILPEAYVKARYRAFEAYAGRRREVYGLGPDSALSSGSYSWSGNALPMIKVQVAIPQFWPANGRLAIRGTFAQGWFDNGFVENSLLHQKSLYIRLGRPGAALKLYGGFNHQVQWAGRTKWLTNEFIKGNQFPSSWQDYWYTIAGTSLNTVRGIDTTRYSTFDRGNRVGNHLGTIDLGAEVRLGQVSVMLYRQSIYEDGSLFYLININDGLHGLRLQNRKPTTGGFRLNTLVLEFLNTYSQGGNAFVDGDPKRRGRDDYFNHGQYRDGWSYRGRSLGTPFIAPATDLDPELPSYLFTNNNRVRVYHAGLSGQVADAVRFSLKASYSQNAGTYQVPFLDEPTQRSGIATVSVRLRPAGVWLNTAVAVDRGGLYSRNTGFALSLVKEGEL